MMTVADEERFERHRDARNRRPPVSWLTHDLALPMLLFGSMGAITWAIRGSSGWGGWDGTIVPGMTWGLIWYYLCWRKGIDARGVALWLGLGIAIGGELGYGQYVSWIQGKFSLGNATLAISPWIGYLWFVIVGVGWGAPGGIILGWALNERVSPLRWVIRILVPVGVGYLGWRLVQACPQYFFPNYDLGFYGPHLGQHLERTVYTNTQNFTVVAWWFGAMLVALVQRDRTTLMTGALIGGGFGLGFTLAALWCLGYTYAPQFIDWWKMWELNAGFNLGVLYTIALYFATRRIKSDQATQNVRLRRMSLLVAVFFLLYILFRGMTYRLGIIMDFYTDKVSDQYAWPAARNALFQPIVFVLVIATLIYLWRIWTRRETPATASSLSLLAARMVDLFAIIGFVGAITIWPSKIGVLYAFFLFLALFAFSRINRELDRVDAGEADVTDA